MKKTSITEICGLLGYSKQAYYKSLKRLSNKSYDEHIVVELVKKKRKIWKKGSGRNLLASLQKDFSEHSIKLGRDKFFEVLRKNGLLMKRKNGLSFCKAPQS